MNIAERYEETLPLTRAIKFPVELIPPDGFAPELTETWPKVDGRMEYVEGRLLYMPPCADIQQYVVLNVAGVIYNWLRAHPGFRAGTNEAGIKLKDTVRAADAAIWLGEAVGEPKGKVQDTPPILAVEVAGEDEDEAVLRAKSRWYLDNDVEVVWIVLPEVREVVVLTKATDQRCHSGETLPECLSLPELAPCVDELFSQLARP